MTLPDRNTERALIEAARQNPDSFGDLMRTYEAPLLRYLRRVAGLPTEELEDVLQETFLSVYRHLNAYDPTLPFSSWVYRIAHNALVDRLRRNAVRPTTVAMEEDETIQLARANVNLERELSMKDCLETIRTVIGRLPVAYREALVLRFLEEKSYEEIMDILEKPKGTVATLIARGRKLLIAELERDGVDCHPHIS
jgi:RNA polymerase sigma-70 factor (ECF subfamily)